MKQNNNAQNTGDVVDVIRQLGATLTKLIELMLSKEIKVRKEIHCKTAMPFKFTVKIDPDC